MKDLAISLRPRTLDEEYSQAGVINELKERAKDGAWPTAMLLKGHTGSGKTTVGQIIAMTINCNKLDENNNPCGKCASCKSIIEERFDRDTIVLDGSTIGLKDDIVSLGQMADMSPMYDKKKVLIIEESDQLSASAKNALHKILEKPRKHVHFILLSMVSTGLPPSIQSRCQTYNFKHFGIKETAIALKSSMEKLNLWDDSEIPNSFKLEGILTLATAAKGSLREGLQYLEKCITGKYYTKEEILNNLGIVDEATVNDLLSRLLNLDVSFFKVFNSIDYMEFYRLGYNTLSEAFVYSLTGVTQNEYFEGFYKSIGKHPRLREALILFEEFYKESKPYLKREYMISRLAFFFSKANAIVSKAPESDATTFKTRQALLDAEAQSRVFSTQNQVPTRSPKAERL